MSLNAVLSYMQSQLDGLTIAGTTNVPAAKAVVNPPVVGDFAANPWIFIWGGKGNEKRKSTSGTRQATIGAASGGFREHPRMIDIYIKYALPASDPNAGSIMPLLIDKVEQTLRTPTIPFNLTDAVSGDVSSVTNYGEEFDEEYGDIAALENQSEYWLFSARITVKVVESIKQ